MNTKNKDGLFGNKILSTLWKRGLFVFNSKKKTR